MNALVSENIRFWRIVVCLLTVTSVSFLGWYSCAVIWDTYDSNEDEITIARERVARQDFDISKLGELEQAASNDSLGLSQLLVPGETDAVAEANLQEALQELIRNSNATVFTVEPIPAIRAGTFHQIGVRAHIAIDYIGLARLLRSIDEKKSAMFVDNLQISRSDSSALRSASGFDVWLTLYGFAEPKVSAAIP